MQSLRSGILRPISIVLLVLAVTACSSGASSAPPASSGPEASGAVSTGSSALAGQTAAATTVAPSVAASAPSGGSSACPAGSTGGHAKYTLNGFEAWHMCGPATATVTLGGTTVHISSGFCSVPSPGTWAVAIGTQVFGDPPASVEPDFLNIYIVSADGKTDPGGVVDHKGWLLIGASIAFGPGKMSGTFSGTTRPGTTVTGSFTCQ